VDVPHSFRKDVCMRKKREGKQRDEKQIEKGKRADIKMKSHRLINTRLSRVIELSRYEVERRGFTECGSPIYPRLAYTRGTHESPHMYPLTWRATVCIYAMCKLGTALRPNKIEVWSAEIVPGRSYVQLRSLGHVVLKFLLLSWNETPLKDRWRIIAAVNWLCENKIKHQILFSDRLVPI